MKYRTNKYIRVCIVSCNIVSFDLECRLLILWKFCWARHNKWCILMAFVCFPVGWSFCLVIVNLFVWLSCCLHFFLLICTNYIYPTYCATLGLRTRIWGWRWRSPSPLSLLPSAPGPTSSTQPMRLVDVTVLTNERSGYEATRPITSWCW